MYKIFQWIARYYYKFNNIDLFVFIFGLCMITNILAITIIEWQQVAKKTIVEFDNIKKILASANLEDKAQIHLNAIYPNATKLFWGGSTYWFTFMSNVFLTITFVTFPFYKDSKKGQHFFFASVVYITITFIVYWLSIIIDTSEFTNMSKFSKIKSLIFHLITPFVGIFCLILYRNSIIIENSKIWILSVFPFFYYLFNLAVYFIGYDFVVQYGGSELDRGVVIYKLISFYHPFGYRGNNVFILITFNVILFLNSVLTAPIIGFLYRQLFNIKINHNINYPKLIFKRKK
ncbi:MAGa3780 family membrane protein [Mycoplasmopsis cricetuli]|uniref:MAGa3780 family membrane protein n=1 Tax=Mycoplasmopsis cricetuli TaxID=171283 RepID=UPI0004703A79|nr:hypothetical protein [Mycoplasmopsis cricetuli]